jgi:hypothetical protein
MMSCIASVLPCLGISGPEDTSKPNDYYTKTVDESFDEFGKPTPLIPKHGNTLATTNR